MKFGFKTDRLGRGQSCGCVGGGGCWDVCWWGGWDAGGFGFVGRLKPLIRPSTELEVAGLCMRVCVCVGGGEWIKGEGSVPPVELGVAVTISLLWHS